MWFKGTVAWDFLILSFSRINSTYVLDSHPKLSSNVFFFSRVDIHENSVFSKQFPGKDTQTLNNFQASLPGYFSTSINNIQRFKITGYCYLYISQLPGNDTWKLRNVLVSVLVGWISWKKIKNLFKNQLWSIFTCIDLWVQAQKMGSSKHHFCNLRVSLPGDWKYFREYLCENKNISENILGCWSGA